MATNRIVNMSVFYGRLGTNYRKDVRLKMKIESKSLFQTHFSSKEFSKRRESLKNQVEDEAIVIIIGKSGHELETFRQSNNFFYMSGVEVPSFFNNPVFRNDPIFARYIHKKSERNLGSMQTDQIRCPN